MMAKEFKRVMSLFMVLVLCLGMMNLSVLATEGFTPVYSDSEVQIEGESVPLSVAHGMATYDEEMDSSYDNVFHRADSLMYRKKREMKNC